MRKLRWAIVVGLIAISVGIVTGQGQQESPSMEQRIATLELQVEELMDMHLDVMKIRPGKNYERDVKRRMDTFRRNLSNIPMKVRSR